MDAFAAIGRRVSARAFRDAPVARELIQRLLDAAVRAPNHKLTEPWRFAVLAGSAKERLAGIQAAHRAKRFADAAAPEAVAAAERVRREALETPLFVVAMCAVSEDEVTREEDYGAAMMALANLMVAARSLALGTYLRTGGIMRDAALAELVGLPEGFRVVGIVSLGYPAAEEAPRRRTPVEQVTRWLD